MENASNDDPQTSLTGLFNFSPRARGTSDFAYTYTTSPVSFYDLHCADNLALKRITNLSTLTSDLGRGLDAFLSNKHALLSRLDRTRLQTREGGFTRLRNAFTVASGYGRGIGRTCADLASRLVLTPSSSSWESVLDWSEWSDREMQRYPELAICSSCICIDGEEDAHWKSIVTNERAKEITSLGAKCPELVTYEVYSLCDDSVNLLRNLHHAATDNFQWKRRSIQEKVVENHVPGMTPDSPSLLGILSEVNGSNPPLSGPRRSERLKARLETDIVGLKNARPIPKFWGIIRPPRLSKNRSVKKRSMNPSEFIQRAWSRAVASDTTFVIFYCGSLQRVGIRHRETQTLYLSDVFDVHTSSNPPFGKLQAAITVLATEDALDRGNLQDEASSPPSRKRKSQGTEPYPRRSKRAKTKADSDFISGDLASGRLVIADTMLRHVSLLNVCLMQLRTGFLSSPAPAFFVRHPAVQTSTDPVQSSGRIKRQYSRGEYVVVIAGDKIGKGATGIVHRATLAIVSNARELLRVDVAVKFAFDDKGKRNLSYEHSIYQRLTGAEGAVPSYGLFEDFEGGPMALILGYGGTPLPYHRAFSHPSGDSQRVYVPESQRSKFVTALQSIHSAGVRNRDVRPWNLLMDQDGSVHIIDFDQAVLESDPRWLQMEQNRLAGVLNGTLTDFEVDQ